MQGSDRRSAARAAAQVRAELEQRLAVGGALREGVERRGEAFALDARLELLVEAHEALPALGDAAVDLRVRPSEPLADLGVGEPLRLEHQGPCLVALEPPHDLGGALDPLAGLEALLDRSLCDGGDRVEVDLLAGDGGSAAADGQGLVLDDDLHPCQLRRGVEGVDSAHVDLERALDRVVGVVGAERVLAGDPQEQVAVAGDDGRDPLLRVGERPLPAVDRTSVSPRAAVLLQSDVDLVPRSSD